MTRRHHRKLSLFRRRQLNTLLPAESSSDSSPPGRSSSSSNAQPDSPAGNAGNSGTTGNTVTGTTGSTSDQGSGVGNSPPNSDGPPIGRPKDPNPLPSIVGSSDPSVDTAIPSIDPSPPKGAKAPPVPSSSSTATPSNTQPSTNTAVNSLSGISGSTPSTALPVSSSPTAAAVQTAVVPLSSGSHPFSSLPLTSPSASLVGPHSTVTGLLPTTTGNSTGAASSPSVSTSSIVGIAAGSLCGLAIFGAACLWIGKRVSRYMETKSLEPPPMHEPIADEETASITRRPSGPSTAPRPPTMIERRQANFAGRGNGFYNNVNDTGFNTQPSVFPPYTADPRFGNASPFAPGSFYSNPSQPQPYFNPIATPSPFDDVTAAPSTPGTPVYFSRQNSIQSGYNNTAPSNASEQPLPNPYDTPVARPNDGYATLNRGPGSVTPQQARHYSDLARQLDLSFENRTASPAPSTGTYAQVPLIPKNTSVPASPKSPSFKAVTRSPSVVNVPTELHEGRATPVQFGFTNATPAPAEATMSSATHVQPVSQPTASGPHSVRPETVYDEEDAYAAI